MIGTNPPPEKRASCCAEDNEKGDAASSFIHLSVLWPLLPIQSAQTWITRGRGAVVTGTSTEADMKMMRKPLREDGGSENLTKESSF